MGGGKKVVLYSTVSWKEKWSERINALFLLLPPLFSRFPLSLPACVPSPLGREEALIAGS